MFELDLTKNSNLTDTFNWYDVGSDLGEFHQNFADENLLFVHHFSCLSPSFFASVSL